MKFFYYLLRGKFYIKALQLAKHLDLRSIYLDLYYACDHDQEKTIMNVCAQKLAVNTQSDKEDEQDDESGLSVTSSDEELESDVTVKQKFPLADNTHYGDINEILTSAIEHYQLDENMYKSLLDRMHAAWRNVCFLSDPLLNDQSVDRWGRKESIARNHADLLIVRRLDFALNFRISNTNNQAREKKIKYNT